MTDTERVGPFYYTDPEGSFEAWGFTFPSGYTVVEWEPVAEDIEPLEHAHQSVYHSFDDFQTVCTGTVDWGISPEQFGNVRTEGDRDE